MRSPPVSGTGASTPSATGWGGCSATAARASGSGGASYARAAGALDGCGAPTALVDLLLAELGIDTAIERGPDGRVVALGRLVDAVYQLVPVELARFAPLAFEAAARGDEVAAGIVAGAAAELVATISAVVTPGLAGPVVLGGGVLSQQPAIAERVVEALRAEGIDGPFITVADGTVGAAVLALRHGGVVVDDIVFARITSSLAALR